MTRKLALLFAGAMLCASAGAEPRRQVDLDAPGALEQVRRERPAHVQAVTRILREAPERKPQAIAGWVRTAFDARMASAMLIKTSYPPRARLEFVLDDTEYRALVTLRNVEPSLSPAVHP
ncbi:hypothetical protein [Massilia sp. ST3]|uniref:hypothetical protein n=1 Tax=Massilia sp. ST3 TaxID=2824903 RepID=UPI001B83AFCD|nr:hypothetical protein [Massilia sp. ST3]MBQ5948145.1 hypothetical protein [Massilia sp. ST3]